MTQKLFYVSLYLDLQPQGMSEREAKRRHAKDDTGACDALWLASFCFRDDGGLSIAFDSFNSEGKDLEDAEWLRIWAFMAGKLHTSVELTEDQRRLCMVVWQTWNEKFQGEIVKTEPGEHTYYLAYKTKKYPSGLTLEQAQRRQVFASDAFALACINRPYSGVLFAGVDGRNDHFTDDLWWKAWAVLAKHLLDHGDLTPPERAMPAFAFTMICDLMAAEEDN